MEKIWKRLLALFLLLAALSGLLLPAGAVEAEDTRPYIREMLNYYRYYQTGAETEIAHFLGQIERIDAAQAETWGNILDNWTWIYEEMEINREVLPDGLPEDDSLCIVVFGLSLNWDGSMRQELVKRLEVALRSAEKYPNAYILCTGGPTSGQPGVSEGGQMAKWLVEQGIEESRVIAETESLDTAENVRNLHRILTEEYPQVRYTAVVTSEYHVQRCVLMLGTMCLYAEGYEGTPMIRVLSNAVCHIDGKGSEGIFLQAEGVARIAGVELENMSRPQLGIYPMEEETIAEAETETAESTELPSETTVDTQPETAATKKTETSGTMLPSEEVQLPPKRAWHRGVFTMMIAAALVIFALWIWKKGDKRR